MENTRLSLNNVNLISQVIIVKNWTFEAAEESAQFLHVVVNDMIKSNKVDIELEQPEAGIFIYRVKDIGEQHGFTFTFMIHPNLAIDIYNVSG